jgi:hypothetical protein
MSETRETANAAMDRAIPHVAGDSASGRAEEPGSFSRKNSQREFFREKKKNVPCCRRRVGPVIQINAWFGTDRVRRVNQKQTLRRT